MNIEEKVKQFMDSLDNEVLIDASKLTSNELLEHSIKLTRESIYKQYPLADCKVVEGLLLNLKTTYNIFFKQSLPNANADQKVADWDTTEEEETTLEFLRVVMINLSLGLMEALKEMYS